MNSERGALTAALGAALILPLSGCVTINAPEKPIRIDLNINVTQEVVYRLDKESKNLIEDNPDIFGGS
ncbi:YnbE family lipoprotein [Stakelama pacifica]|nr:YnbE family lipoprotein [Stakelama pacifica]